jgi:hypothetical protein
VVGASFAHERLFLGGNVMATKFRFLPVATGLRKLRRGARKRNQSRVNLLSRFDDRFCQLPYGRASLDRLIGLRLAETQSG